MVNNIDLQQLRESEVLALVDRAAPLWFPGAQVEREPRLSPRYRPDFRVSGYRAQIVILEVKGYRFTTGSRIAAALVQLAEYLREARAQSRPGTDIRTGLVIAGPLSADARKSLLAAGVSYVSDGDDLLLAVAQAEGGVTGPSAAEKPNSSLADLRLRLADIPSGSQNWSDYRQTIRNVLERLWCPPLEKALYESSNDTGVNRRDMIFPNYASSGFWEYLRRHYAADHVVVDAKNSGKPLKKESVLQVANYPSVHGAGLFGVILARRESSKGAEQTRREQWIVHRKLVLVLFDEDVSQMVSFRERGGDPADQVRQKIEDFRLSF